MNTHTYRRMILVILVALLVAPLNAQTPYDPVFMDEASRIREQLYVFTDRSIYAVDEIIYFVADHRISGPTGNLPWSNVLYVELVEPGGDALVRGKFRLSGGLSKGSLHLPAEVLTGTYYLKCYTRWMRNAGPETFSYTPLKIINPFTSEVAGMDESETAAAPVQRIAYKSDMLECTTASDSYQAGQEAVLKVHGMAAAAVDHLRCAITVVPKGAVNLTEGQLLAASPDEDRKFRVDLLPDLGDNISISGTVVGPDQEPVSYTTLHFSLLGEDPDYFAAMSDIHGKFVISTPTGLGEYKEFFVTPEQEEGSALVVRIDQEYDSRPIGKPVAAFRLIGEELDVARNIALNMQLRKVFTTGESDSLVSVMENYSGGKRVPFYGIEVKRLFIDDYVMLPNLEEVFINLIPEVQFYRQQGRKRIQIQSDNSSIAVYNPLIMIDHISVFDHEALLALSPEKIERIDLINDIYLKGSVPFGGVLAIHSRKGDMAGIDLPVDSYFFDYQAFHSISPRIDPLPVLDERMPDTRNTLLWNPNLILQQGEQVEIPFRVPKARGNYVALVRTVSPNGEVFAATAEFSVK